MFLERINQIKMVWMEGGTWFLDTKVLPVTHKTTGVEVNIIF